MNKTPNYNLNQWEANDRVLRTDFNADNAKIDAAIKAVDAKVGTKADISALAALGNCRVVYGTYVGTGTCGSANPTVLRLGFQPKLVMVGYDLYIATFIWNCTYGRGPSYAMIAQWLPDGLQWHMTNDSTATPREQMNENGVTYHYIAFY